MTSHIYCTNRTFRPQRSSSAAQLMKTFVVEMSCLCSKFVTSFAQKVCLYELWMNVTMSLYDQLDLTMCVYMCMYTLSLQAPHQWLCVSSFKSATSWCTRDLEEPRRWEILAGHLPCMHALPPPPSTCSQRGDVSEWRPSLYTASCNGWRYP